MPDSEPFNLHRYAITQPGPEPLGDAIGWAVELTIYDAYFDALAAGDPIAVAIADIERAACTCDCDR
jgi:hypothetical protein